MWERRRRPLQLTNRSRRSATGLLLLTALAPPCCGQLLAPPTPAGSGCGSDLNGDQTVHTPLPFLAGASITFCAGVHGPVLVSLLLIKSSYSLEQVNVEDLLLVLGAFGSSTLSGAQLLDADVNRNGVVNVADLLLVLGAFGSTCRPIGCGAMRGDVCDDSSCRRFVGYGMYGRSCAEYCCEFGLGCVGAWEEQANNCEAEETWTCEQTQKSGGGSTDDVICECDGNGSTLTEACPPPPPPRRTCTDLAVEGHADRSSCVYVPAAEPGAVLPLIVVLHGYTGNRHQIMRWWHMEQLADDRGVIVATADGTTDSGGTTFWDATDYCCNFGRAAVDDSGFLRALIEAVQAGFPVDPQRIYVSGHSNGGFMSYRMACDHADLIAGIASLAGAAFEHAATPMHNMAYTCAPTEPVHVLQIHGSRDGTIPYGGGGNLPSASGSVRRFAAFNGCDETTSPAGNTLSPDLSWDLVQPQGGDTTNSWHDNCPPGGSAELWTVEGGSHSPELCAEEEGEVCTSPDADGVARLTARMVDWLLQRRKP
jgi:polyhydroxybutyrate depolymerase